MVNTTVSHRHSAWCHHNLYVFLFSLCKQVYIFHDAKVVDNLIRNVFLKFLGIRQTYHLLFIVHTDKNVTTLSIGETAYPFQIFVSPILSLLQQVLIRQKIQQSNSQYSKFVLLAMNVITNNDNLTKVVID